MQVNRTVQNALKLVVTGLLMLAIACSLVACGGSSSNKPASQTIPENPYLWKNLSYEHGRYSYTVDGTVVSRTGVDVSDHQGVIDWNAAANDGIDFAIIRIGNRGYTEGGLYLDEQFEANMQGARAAGIDVGVYFFSQAITVEEAVEEADFVINALKGRWIAYPVVFDEESISDAKARANDLTKSEQTAIARAFLERIEGAGYHGMLYCNRADMYGFDLNELSRWPVWYAEYGATPGPTPDFTIWQYTSNGYVEGIPGATDMNLDLTAAR